MRFQLKQILPVTLLLTGVLAASNTKDEATSTAVSEASATDDSATATATDESTATATDDSSSATGTEDSTITTKATKTTKTTAKGTYTYVASTAATTAPDLLSSDSFSFRDSNYIVVSLSVSLVTAAMTFL